MVILKLNKKTFFIPTPGQYEQEYLADKLKKEGLVPYSKQEQFTIKDLEEISNYKGLQEIKFNLDWSSLFSIFR